MPFNLSLHGVVVSIGAFHSTPYLSALDRGSNPRGEAILLVCFDWGMQGHQGLCFFSVREYH